MKPHKQADYEYSEKLLGRPREPVRGIDGFFVLFFGVLILLIIFTG